MRIGYPLLYNYKFIVLMDFCNPQVNTAGFSFNLDQHQREALETHQKLIATEIPSMSDPKTCLRYLRSTGFDVAQAAEMMRKTAVSTMIKEGRNDT